MAEVDRDYCKPLIDAGLHLYFLGFTYGLRICKPRSVKGNSVPGYRNGYVSLDDNEGKEFEPETDAPFVTFFFNGQYWVVWSHEGFPGVQPGDFITEWATANEAIEDILDFYFGDPRRMARCAKFRADWNCRLNAR